MFNARPVVQTRGLGCYRHGASDLHPRQYALTGWHRGKRCRHESEWFEVTLSPKLPEHVPELCCVAYIAAGCTGCQGLLTIGWLSIGCGMFP